MHTHLNMRMRIPQAMRRITRRLCLPPSDVPLMSLQNRCVNAGVSVCVCVCVVEQKVCTCRFKCAMFNAIFVSVSARDMYAMLCDICMRYALLVMPMGYVSYACARMHSYIQTYTNACTYTYAYIGEISYTHAHRNNIRTHT